jgi:hypothetical protein
MKKMNKKRNRGDVLSESNAISNREEDSLVETKEIFKENWSQARHCENMRLWFTNIYAVVVAGILVFMGETTELGPVLLFLSFGLILSVLGLLIVIAASLGYENYFINIVTILYYWDKMEFFNVPSKPVHFRSMHRCFYEITIALFGALLQFYLLKIVILAIFVFIGIFLILEGVYRIKLKKYFELRWAFTKALLHDTERFYRRHWDILFKNTDPEFREIVADRWRTGESLDGDFLKEIQRRYENP